MSRALIFVLLVVAAVLAAGSCYVVGEREQVIVTEFGRPIGAPITEAGLHWKKPFLQDVRRLDKRVLFWRGEAREISTREKKFIFVDTMARWRIADPLLFLQSVGDARNAQTRLDNIIDGVVKDTVSSQGLIDVVRASGREMAQDVDTSQDEAPQKPELGRPELMKRITQEAAIRLAPLGIELLDVRITRVNFVEQVLADVYQRMISERRRIAEQFRSEGLGEKARILGELERDQKTTISEAERDASIQRGTADATAARTYAEAYQKDPAFYAFLKSLETLKTALAGGETTVVLSTDGELLRLLESPEAKSQ
jgi:membrane protease subunit HflC